MKYYNVTHTQQTTWRWVLRATCTRHCLTYMLCSGGIESMAITEVFGGKLHKINVSTSNYVSLVSGFHDKMQVHVILPDQYFNYTE